MSAQASCPVIPAQCSPRSKYPWGAHWVVRRSVAEVSALRVDGGIVIPGRGRAVRPYTRSDVPCERPLPLPLGEVAERSEDGEGKP